MLLYAIFAVTTFTAVQRVGKGAAYRPFVLVYLQNAILQHPHTHTKLCQDYLARDRNVRFLTVMWSAM